MTNRRKKRAKQRPADTSRRAAPSAPADRAARRERKEHVRAARAHEARRAARRQAVRRAGSFAAAGILGVVAITFIGRASGAEPLSQAAAGVARAAGCQNVDLAPQLTGDVSREHFPAGQSTPYSIAPAAAGDHAAQELTPTVRVLTEPPDEARAVHNLEHGSVILYYRPPGDPGGLSQEVIDALGPLAERNRATYLAPHPDLPEGTALALTAWNVVVPCPGTITVDQATTLAQGFVDSLACTSNAPEGKLGDGC